MGKKWRQRERLEQRRDRRHYPENETQGEGPGEQAGTTKNATACRQRLQGLPTEVHHGFYLFWMWKPSLREHKELTEGHMSGKWWAQDTNPHRTDSTPLHSLCRASLQGRDSDRRGRNTSNRWANEKRTFCFTGKRP